MAEEMDCAELESLQARYEQAAAEFTETNKEVHSSRFMPAPKFTVLAEKAEAAKTKAETARRVLRNHMIEHGCLLGPRWAPISRIETSTHVFTEKHAVQDYNSAIDPPA